MGPVPIGGDGRPLAGGVTPRGFLCLRWCSPFCTRGDPAWLRGKGLGPLCERQVGGDRNGPLIVSLVEKPVDRSRASLTGPRPITRSGNSSPRPERVGLKPVCGGKEVPEQTATKERPELFLERSCYFFGFAHPTRPAFRWIRIGADWSRRHIDFPPPVLHRNSTNARNWQNFRQRTRISRGSRCGICHCRRQRAGRDVRSSG